MARILETIEGKRRTIKLTTDDILSIVREYQRIVGKLKNVSNIRNHLEDNVIYIPEDI